MVHRYLAKKQDTERSTSRKVVAMASQTTLSRGYIHMPHQGCTTSASANQISVLSALCYLYLPFSIGCMMHACMADSWVGDRCVESCIAWRSTRTKKA